LAKIISNGKEVELREYILKSLAKTDSTSIRDVDRSIDYFLNLVEPFSEMITLLYDKKLLNVDDVRKIIKSQEISIID
jgi:hypothetical protein